MTLVRFFGGLDNLLSGWPKATGGDPKASLEPGLSERFCGDLLCAARPRTTSCPGHLLFRDCCFALIFLLPLACAARADITGTVTLVGKPNSHDETFLAAASNCGESPIRHTENWKVGPKGELGDVVVWIIDPKFQAVTIPPPASPEIELKQLGCRYVPHVIAVQAGVNFKITNCDPTLHNIRAKNYVGPGQPPGADVFNFGQASQGQTDEKEFDDPGIYTLQCDVHGWMQCWVMVLKDGVFGVTGLDGRFKLQSSDTLADGDYKIDAWHPRFAQTLEQTIHVKNGTATVVFQFEGAKSF